LLDYNAHCDIKPLNILILRGGAEVCDFGHQAGKHLFAVKALTRVQE